MIIWFFGALGLSLAVLFIGLKKSALSKRRKMEVEVYYELIRQDCLAYAERLYQK